MGIYRPMDYEELDSLLSSYLSRTYSFFPFFKEAFILLYHTGCRVSELFEINRWRRINDITLAFTPQKFNSERIVPIPSGVSLFPQWVDFQTVPWFGHSIKQLNSMFMSFSPFVSYLADTKSISLYLFRYRYIRFLFSNGWSLSDIQTIMGYSSTTVIYNYLNSSLFYYDQDETDYIKYRGLYFVRNRLTFNDGHSGIITSGVFNPNLTGYYYNIEAVEHYFTYNTKYRLLTRAELVSILDLDFDPNLSFLSLCDGYFWPGQYYVADMVSAYTFALSPTGSFYAGVLDGFFLNENQSYIFWYFDEVLGHYNTASYSPFYRRLFAMVAGFELRYAPMWVVKNY